jgi:c-di-GMP-binding flagellar brake protein YcgR
MIHRRYERTGFLCRVDLATGPNSPRIPGQSIDISLGGVGIMTQAAFEAGQMLTITFFLKNAAQKEVRNQAVGRVVNLKADVDANRLGVEFLEPLQESKQPELVRRLLRI